MNQLREQVEIRTTTGTLPGHLFVGHDGLPVLRVDTLRPEWEEDYRPATFPAAWEVQQAEPDAGVLFCAWRTISELQFEIVQTQRE